MDADRFDTLTRTLTDVRSRRGALAMLLGGTLSLLGLAETAAKKGKGKKKKNGGNPSPPPPSPPSSPPSSPPPPPSCAQACDSSCFHCYSRAVGPLLCADSSITSCVTCSSDNDCAGTAHPYCITSGENRENGQVSRLCPGSDGYCASLDDCPRG